MKKQILIPIALFALVLTASAQTVVRTNQIAVAWGLSPDDPKAGGSMTNITYRLYVATNSAFTGAVIFSNTVYTVASNVSTQGRITLLPNVVYFMRATALDEEESDPTAATQFIYQPIRKPRTPASPPATP